MGKYMRKPKITCDVAVTEPELGVRTRAKTLALQKLQSNDDTSSCYIQLRSRRLIKQNPSPKKSPNLKPEEVDLGSEDGARIGENCLDFESFESRSDRESTPCSYVRESVTVETPGSTNKQTFSTATNLRKDASNSITQEIEEFFASAEKQQQRLFAERFNFDVVNDMPLPGRYEWVRVEN